MALFYDTVADLIAAGIPASGTLASVNGEMFVYDGANTDAPNQLSIICPTAKSTEATENSIDITGGVTLANTKLLFDTVTLVDTVGGIYNCTDLRLSGHRIGTRATPYIDHAAGTIDEFVAATFNITYRYASAAGRWRRVWSQEEPVCPYMLGAAGGGADDSGYISWAMYFANTLNRDVFIDQEYHYTRPIKIYSGQLLFGRAMTIPGLSVIVEDVLDRYRTDLSNTTPNSGIDSALSLTLGDEQPSISPISAATTCRIKNLQIDGKVQDFDWDRMDGEAEGTWNETDIFATWAGGYRYGGVSATTDNSQNVTDCCIQLDNVWVHDFCASPLKFDNSVNDGSWLSNVRVGNCIGDRMLNGFNGVVTNIEFHGFTRYDLCELHAPVTCFGFLYEENTDHPRADQVDHSPGAIQQVGVAGDMDDIRDGREPGVFLIQGIDVDFTGSHMSDVAYLVELNHECRIQGTTVGAAPFILGSVFTGAIEKCTFDLVTEDGPGAMGWHASGTDGALSLLNINHQNRQTTRPTPAGDGTFDQGNQTNWTSLINPSYEFKLFKEAGLSSEHRQVIKISYDSDYPCGHILKLADLEDRVSGDIVPSEFWLSGRFDNKFPTLFHGTESDTDVTVDYDAINTALGAAVRIFAEGLTFNVIIGGANSWPNVMAAQLEIFKMRACRTPDNELSEQDGTAVWSSGASISVATKLLWKPRRVVITPLTPDAQAFYNGYEWAGITDEGLDTEDSRSPTLQINLNATPTTEDIQFAWACAVSPF